MKRILTACYFTACVLSASLVHAQQVRIVAMTGDTMPRGDGVFTGFGRFVLGDSGDVAFEAAGRLTGSTLPASMRGIYAGDGVTPLQVIAQLGDLAPNNRVITDSAYPAINAFGQVSYSAITNREITYVVEDRGVVVSWATSGDLRSDGPGELSVISQERAHLANSGALTFPGRLVRVSIPDSSSRLGIFQTQGNVTTTVARDGEPTPSGELQWLYGAFGQISDFSVNSLGQVAVISPVRDIASGSVRNGVFVVDGTSILEYPGVGSPAPNGNGIIASIYDPVLNDQQSVAFHGILTGTVNGIADREGIFRVNGTDLVELVRTGDPAPYGPGNLRTLDAMQLNARGQVLAVATFSAGMSFTNTGFVLADETGIHNVARAGTLHPNGSMYYTSVRYSALNDLGQVAFEAAIGTNPISGSAAGIFLYDEGDTRTIALTGTPLLGSTITRLSLFSDYPLDQDYLSSSRKPFNNLGQIAYHFTLADGRSGIAVWSIPEVPAGYLAIVAVLAIFAMHRRGHLSHP